LYQTLKRHPDWYVDKINTGDDHVHLLLEIPPTYAVAAVVQELKLQTSKDLRKHFKFIDNMYHHSGVWGTGYFVSSVGLNEEQIRHYIEKQSNDDRPVDITDEFS
jgi:putative transposase